MDKVDLWAILERFADRLSVKKIRCRASDIYSVFLFCKAYVYVSIPPCIDTDAQSTPPLTSTETSPQGTDRATKRDLILGGWKGSWHFLLYGVLPCPHKISTLGNFAF